MFPLERWRTPDLNRQRTASCLLSDGKYLSLSLSREIASFHHKPSIINTINRCFIPQKNKENRVVETILKCFRPRTEDFCILPVSLLHIRSVSVRASPTNHPPPPAVARQRLFTGTNFCCTCLSIGINRPDAHGRLTMDADAHGLPPVELRCVFGFNGEEAAGGSPQVGPFSGTLQLIVRLRRPNQAPCVRA